MRAIGHTTFGGPEVLHEVEVARPEVGPDEIRVRVSAAGVNPTDAIRRSGARAEWLEKQERPWVPGMDFAGTVDSIGEQVDTDLDIGDRVMGLLFPEGTRGAYADEVVVSHRSVVAAPAGLSDIESAVLPMTALTAVLSLDRLGLSPGNTLGVTGSAGIYGAYLIQLAVRAGIHVVADSNDRDLAFVRSLGPEAIVERGDDVAERMLEQVPGGLDAVADGALLNERVLDAVRPGGSVVTLRHFRDDSRDDIRFLPVFITDYLYEREKLDAIRALAEQRILTPRVAGVFPAAEAAEAHAAMERRGAGGRFVLDFGDGWNRSAGRDSA